MTTLKQLEVGKVYPLTNGRHMLVLAEIHPDIASQQGMAFRFIGVSCTVDGAHYRRQSYALGRFSDDGTNSSDMCNSLRGSVDWTIGIRKEITKLEGERSLIDSRLATLRREL